MNIKLKLTLWFTLIVATILAGSFYIVYQNYSHFRESNFYDRLNDRAHYAANALLELDGIDQYTVEAISHFNLSVAPNLRLSLYDINNKLIRQIGNTIPSSEQSFKNLQVKKHIEAEDNDTQYVSFMHTRNGHEYVVLSASVDKAGYNKVSYLRNIFILIWLGSIITTSFAGWWYASVSLRPMSEVIKDVENISSKNLHNRLTVSKPYDEIAHLSYTFNQMLNRLESAFKVQKSFVSNASHEFRTPLAAIKGQVQVALLKDRSTAEYKQLLESLNEDVNDINALLNALQALAKASSDFPLASQELVPILDIILECQNEFHNAKPHYTIEVTVNDVSNQNFEVTCCMGDASLLKSAISNIIDNGCKFSPDYKVHLTVIFTDNAIRFICADEGVGIPEESLELIFEPFFRGNDTRNIHGYGIGLSLVKRIVELHSGTLNIISALGKGTTVTVELPNAERSIL
jgi:signal transduction histidine kinase